MKSWKVHLLYIKRCHTCFIIYPYHCWIGWLVTRQTCLEMLGTWTKRVLYQYMSIQSCTLFFQHSFRAIYMWEKLVCLFFFVSHSFSKSGVSSSIHNFICHISPVAVVSHRETSKGSTLSEWIFARCRSMLNGGGGSTARQKLTGPNAHFYAPVAIWKRHEKTCYVLTDMKNEHARKGGMKTKTKSSINMCFIHVPAVWLENHESCLNLNYEQLYPVP